MQFSILNSLVILFCLALAACAQEGLDNGDNAIGRAPVRIVPGHPEPAPIESERIPFDPITDIVDGGEELDQEEQQLKSDLEQALDIYVLLAQAASEGDFETIRSVCQEFPRFCKMGDNVDFSRVADDLEKLSLDPEYQITGDYSLMDFVREGNGELPTELNTPRNNLRLQKLKRDLKWTHLDIEKDIDTVKENVKQIFVALNAEAEEEIFPVSAAFKEDGTIVGGDETVSRAPVTIDDTEPSTSNELSLVKRDRKGLNNDFKKSKLGKALRLLFNVVWKPIAFVSGGIVVLLGAVLTVLAFVMGSVFTIGSVALSALLRSFEAMTSCTLCATDACSCCCTMFTCRCCWSWKPVKNIAKFCHLTRKGLRTGRRTVRAALRLLPYMTIDLGLKLMGAKEYARDHIEKRIKDDFATVNPQPIVKNPSKKIKQKQNSDDEEGTSISPAGPR